MQSAPAQENPEGNPATRMVIPAEDIPHDCSEATDISDMKMQADLSL